MIIVGGIQNKLKTLHVDAPTDRDCSSAWVWSAHRHRLFCHRAGSGGRNTCCRTDKFHFPIKKSHHYPSNIGSINQQLTFLKYLQSFSLSADLYFVISCSFSSGLSTQKLLGHTKSEHVRHSGQARMILLSNCFACRHVLMHSRQKQ